MTFPRALKVTDAEGRSYTYLAVGPDWPSLRSPASSAKDDCYVLQAINHGRERVREAYR
jgi:hypothetical protein